MIATAVDGLGRLYLTHEDLETFWSADITPPTSFPRWVFLTVGDAIHYAHHLDAWARSNPTDPRSTVAIMLAGDLRLMEIR